MMAIVNILDLTALLPAVPLAGFVILLFGRQLPRRAVAAIGAGSVGIAAILCLLAAWQFRQLPSGGRFHNQFVWQWFDALGFAPRVAFELDALSLLMALVVSVVGFLIHLYAVEYMWGEEGFGRFFAYMNLFVAMMLVLVLADNLLLLYLGWEGVGLCSYLLIGFWYRDRANGRAAMKAFIVTRVGDIALAIGLFVLAWQVGTLDIDQLLLEGLPKWRAAPALAFLPALLLLIGAMGKSAQVPLHTWLPDAMAGPTPVSALIHAATMVTAGVYLIARMQPLFVISGVRLVVGVVGALTLLLAGCSALLQRDIKRVLAWSTISQIGYMFLALGVGATWAAMFHFLTHAFFKALLFLAAGAVILAMHHEQDMFKMGGLRKRLPLVFWTFLIGAASLSALPLVTAGFYSKDAILLGALAGGQRALWMAGIVGAFLTSLYSFRMVFLVFFGQPRHEQVAHRPGWKMKLPLVVLAGGALLAGFLQMPWSHGGFADFISQAARSLPVHVEPAMELLNMLTSSLAAIGGVGLAWWLFLRQRQLPAALAQTPLGKAVGELWLEGWGFDQLYDRLLVRPFVWLARLNRHDCIDWIYRAIAYVSDLLHVLLSRSQTGNLRWYVAGVALGAAVILALVVLL